MPRSKTVNLRPTYKAAIHWIAFNDETAEMDAEVVAGFISVCLVADLFGADTRSVAIDVVRCRA
jgi:hypothetical protein